MPRHTTEACIYCGRPADGREDWFPRWLGRYRGMELLLDRLCDDCNQALGKSVDLLMSRESPQAFNRTLLRIEGRHDGPPNLFGYKNQEPQPPVTLNVSAPCGDLQPHAEIVPGSDPPRSRIIRQLAFQKEDGTHDFIRINPIGPEKDGPWLKEAIRKRGLENARLTDIWCEPDDPKLPNDKREPILWLRRALLFAFPEAKAHAQEQGIRAHWLVDGEVEHHHVAASFRIGVPVEYPRALAKIALHYALKVDTFITGHEDEFAPVKAFVRNGVGEPGRVVDALGRPFVIDRGTALKGVQHFLFLEVNRSGELVVRMHFFVTGSELSGASQSTFGIPPLRVVLGRYPSISTRKVGHCLRLFNEPIDNFDGEILPVEIGKVDGMWGVFPPPWVGRGASM